MDKSFFCSLTNITVNEKNFSLWKKEISKKCIKDDIPEILYNYGMTTNKDDIKFLKKDEYIDLVKSFIKRENEPKKTITSKKEKTKKTKECPEGKILNPKTGRCIKIKNIKTKPAKPEKPKKQDIPIIKNSPHHENLCSSSDLTCTNYMRKRMKKYNNILQAIKKIDNNSCLTVFNDGTNNNYIINTSEPNKKIFLKEKIGTPSVFGINYKAKFFEMIKEGVYKEIPKLDYFVGKIQVNLQDTDVEIKILKFITDQAIKRNLPHLPLLYKNIKCSNIQNREELPDILKTSKHKSYLVTFNEFANGDLKSFLYSKDLSAEIWINAIEQIFMSIAIYHSFGMKHADTHYGNFLYHKIPAGGWFKYVINGNEYYVPNLGYYWIIWDFGVSHKLYTKIQYLDDYNFLTLFLRKDDDVLKKSPDFMRRYYLGKNKYIDKNGIKKEKEEYRDWGYISKKINIPNSVIKTVDELYRASGGYNILYIKEFYDKYISEDIFFENIKNNKILYNHKYDGGEILSNTIIKLASYKISKENRISPSDLDAYHEIKYKGK